jgi:hypothetical protein
MHRRRTALVISMLAASSLLAACGTSSSSAAPGDTAGAGSPGAQTTPAPGATAAPGQTIGDLSGAASALANLSSYKVTMAGSAGTGPFNVELVKINGASPATSFIETSGSAVVFRVILIGTDNWVDQGTGTYAKNLVPNSTLTGMMGAFDPGTMFSNASRVANFGALENKGAESKNGVQAIHLHADQNTQLPAGASPIPAGATIDLWVAVDGQYLVALETVGFGAVSGTDLTIEVTNINDPSLTVTPPS